MSDTVFGKILAGEIPAEFIHEDEHCVAIHDIHPQAPVHVLVIPRKPIPMLVDAQPEDQALLGHLMLVAGKLARELGVGDGFRLIVNNGESVGMTIHHLHLHVMGGRTYSEQGMA
ncbi:MAG: histidine triad nucleotide-binding protein [Halioglobus sp.]|nr:histidine triad nucleotide-binding protein [Halioglobus sp.]MAT94585.1 histidine triad nucleotide-binding protein [Halioglobus sp.]